ncbi:MAG: Maf family nucleotide pyrophosphatase [Flavobacteriaceae bacterium]|jgi:septum formation protein|nr:Maf family nucleotide pyrophosphatase [Flavobacteriaceae bacterium]MDG1942502.1 Maf family nucleotide pyrophosphatase [Flavobacteriaceae bacterium]
MLDLNGFEIILASSSPRRKAFLESLNIPFSIKTFSVDETFPPQLQGEEIAQHIVRQKNAPFKEIIQDHQIVITADTIVWCENRYLGKPQNKKAAKEMLSFLSGKSHEVITSVGFLTSRNFEVITETTKVYFKDLTDQEIDHYIEESSPLDKAGAYGIQEWIGAIGITQIKGSYTNVVGLPLAQVKEKIAILIQE